MCWLDDVQNDHGGEKVEQALSRARPVNGGYGNISICKKNNNTAELGNILTLSTFGKKHRPDSQERQNGNCEPSPLGTCTLPVLTPRPTATNTSSPSRVHYN